MGVTQSSPRRILIVEDDALTTCVYKAGLRPYAAEFVCHCESTGESALARLNDSEADAVVLDWDLPGISGLAVLQKIRANPKTADIPVIMVTGRGDHASETLAYAHGATVYYRKPLQISELALRLRALAA